MTMTYDEGIKTKFHRCYSASRDVRSNNESVSSSYDNSQFMKHCEHVDHFTAHITPMHTYN